MYLGLQTFPGQFTLPGAVVTGFGSGIVTSPPKTAAELARSSRVWHSRLTLKYPGRADEQLAVVSGSIRVEADKAPRRTLSCEVVLSDPIVDDDHSLSPRGPGLIHAEVGISGDGTNPTWYPQGVFTPTLVSVQSSEFGPVVRVDGSDLSVLVKAARIRERILISEGEELGGAVVMILRAAAPWLEIIPAGTAATVPESLFGEFGADPWEEAAELAKNAGLEIYMSPVGVCMVTPVRDPLLDEPVATWSSDDVIVDDEVTLNSSEYVTAVIADWQQRQVVPVSPGVEYHYTNGWVQYPLEDLSPYPRRLYLGGDASTRNGPSVAIDAARAEFIKHDGMDRTYSMSVLPDPRLDVNRTVVVRDAILGLDEIARVTGFSMPLHAESSMRINCANKKVKTYE